MNERMFAPEVQLALRRAGANLFEETWYGMK